MLHLQSVSRTFHGVQQIAGYGSGGPFLRTRYLGRFWALQVALDIRSERLYDLAPDIPDVMGLRALRPSVAIVKEMSVLDSRCIRVVTPDNHVNIGFHEVLLHDMEEEEFAEGVQRTFRLYAIGELYAL